MQLRAHIHETDLLLKWLLLCTWTMWREMLHFCRDMDPLVSFFCYIILAWQRKLVLINQVSKWTQPLLKMQVIMQANIWFSIFQLLSVVVYSVGGDLDGHLHCHHHISLQSYSKSTVEELEEHYVIGRGTRYYTKCYSMYNIITLGSCCSTCFACGYELMSWAIHALST